MIISHGDGTRFPPSKRSRYAEPSGAPMAGDEFYDLYLDACHEGEAAVIPAKGLHDAIPVPKWGDPQDHGLVLKEVL